MGMSGTRKGYVIWLFLAAVAVALVAMCAAPQSAYAGYWKNDSKGFWYIHNSQGDYYTNGWKIIDNKWYHFDKKGYAEEGWYSDYYHWYYLDGKADMSAAKFTALSKVKAAPASYAKFSDGAIHKRPAMATGLTYDGSAMYYLDPTTGYMQTGWIDLTATKTGGWIYANSNGTLASGWQGIGRYWYYFGEDDELGYVAATGFQEIGIETYYLDPTTCAMQTGWLKINDKWYYFASNGVMQTNKWIDGYYYVQADGTMVTDAWIGRYHVDKNGRWDKTKPATTVTTGTTN